MAIAGRWYQASLSGFAEGVLPCGDVRGVTIGVG